jgi:hypothetical protein
MGQRVLRNGRGGSWYTQSIASNLSLRRAALDEASRLLVRAAFAGQPLDLVAVRTDLNFTAALVPLDKN